MIQTLLAIASINIIGAMSPGPDFVVVMKNSLMYGRKHGFATSAGIATANITYCLLVALGLGTLISKSVVLFQAIKIGGALYLIYLAIGLRRSNILTAHIDQTSNTSHDPSQIQDQSQSVRTSFKNGYITNITNPKFIIFLLAMFAQFFTVDTPMYMYLMSALVISTTAGLWFSLLSILAGSPTIQTLLTRYQGIIQKTLGAALGVLGVKILVE